MKGRGHEWSSRSTDKEKRKGEGKVGKMTRALAHKNSKEHANRSAAPAAKTNSKKEKGGKRKKEHGGKNTQPKGPKVGEMGPSRTDREQSPAHDIEN